MAEKEKNEQETDILSDVLGDNKEKDKKIVPQDKGEVSSPFAGLDKPTKIPLVLYIISLVLFLVPAILLGLNVQMEIDWTNGIAGWANSSGLATLLQGWAALIGGLLVPIITLGIALILYLSRSPKTMKYGSLFLLQAILGLGVNRLLMGLFARAGPSAGSVDAWFTIGSAVDPWINGSFTSFLMTLSGVLFVLPYCFNSQKTKVMGIISAILVLVFEFFMGLALIATGKAWFMDVLLAGVMQFWFAAIVSKRVLSVRDQELFDVYNRVHKPVEDGYHNILKAKSVLDYSQVDYALERAKKVFSAEVDKAKAAATKGKPVEYQTVVEKVLELIEKSIGKVMSDKLEVQDNTKVILEQIKTLQSLAKPPKNLVNQEALFLEIQKTLEDNKSFAIELLNNSIKSYNVGIEAAKNEPGDFSQVINRANIWIGHANQFKAELEKLSRTSGTEFESFMKTNFMYII